MILVLVRHGEAVDKAIDPERPLSPNGQREVIDLCERMSHIPLKIECIYHSGILRAKETAQFIKENLYKNSRLTLADHLRPEDPVSHWVNQSKNLECPSMLVGHMPFVSIFTHQLTQTQFLEFPTAGAIALRRTGHGVWDIVWRSF